MLNHRTHQIDRLAQQVLKGALHPTWVLNEQDNDYAKDYLVEIGEDDGNLTGSSFYVQLKGQEKATINTDGTVVKYSLKSKYARYYLDKIKDLPVFLVVVDVNQKKGWWLFLQPALDADHAWRKQGSITISLPVGDEITDAASLRDAVDKAKKWMRLRHPESIHETVIAHKERITRIDPRFDVAVSLVDDMPRFSLLAKEDVSLTFNFSGVPEVIGKKFSDLLNRGEKVAFEPGEVKVTGSKLFEHAEQTGCFLQAATDFTGTLSLVCRDADGSELARLSDVPGRFTGGRKQLWFEGALANSPLVIKLGPIAEGVGGSLKLNLDLHKWDGQSLHKLAYFDRIFHFFHALPNASETEVECQQDGNRLFGLTLPVQEHSFAKPLARFLVTLSRARKIAERFGVNAKWSVEAFGQDAQETAEELHAIFFRNGWTRPMPNVRLTGRCTRKGFHSDAAKRATEPGVLRWASERTYDFLGETVEAGRLVHDYTEMSIKILDKRRPLKKGQRNGKDRGKKDPQPPLRRMVDIALIGSKDTIMRITREEEAFSEAAAGLSLISENTSVREA